MPKGVWDRSKTKAQRQAEKLNFKQTGVGSDSNNKAHSGLEGQGLDLAGSLIRNGFDPDAERMMYLASRNLNEVFALLHSAKTTGENFFDPEIVTGFVNETKEAIANYSLARERVFSGLHAPKAIEAKSEAESIKATPGIGAPYNVTDTLPFTPSALGQAFKEHKS